MSVRVATPPMEPPADTRIECDECCGLGKFTYGDDAELSATCTVCWGDGLIERPDEDSCAPDTWREAEGLA